MTAHPHKSHHGRHGVGGHLRISLNAIEQLFDSLDPSPFRERALDRRAEEFLVSWAAEIPRHVPLRLSIHLRDWPAATQPEQWIAHALHGHFAERARLSKLKLKRLFRQGRVSLVIGLLFLTLFLALAEVLGAASPPVLTGLLRESLAIGGWVAMWRPVQFYLYDWWPLWQRQRLFRRMGTMPVKLEHTVARKQNVVSSPREQLREAQAT